MELNEMISKGIKAQSAQELKEIAAEQDWDMTDEEATAYFDELQKYETKASGELSDDELDNVSGGGCHKDNRLVVTTLHRCRHYECDCGKTNMLSYDVRQKDKERLACSACDRIYRCCRCKYMTYEKGLWLCNNPKNMK